MVALAVCIPLLVALQLWLAGPGRRHIRRDGGPVRMYAAPGSAAERLINALGLHGRVADATIRLPAGEFATMTITKLLTTEEVEALSEWCITEGIELCPTGTTTYNLEPRPTPLPGGPEQPS